MKMKNVIAVLLASFLVSSPGMAGSSKSKGQTRIPASTFKAQGSFIHPAEFKKNCESLGLKGKIALRFEEGKVTLPLAKPMTLAFDSNLKQFISRNLPELSEISDYEGVIHSVDFNPVTGKLNYFSSAMFRGEKHPPVTCETTFTFDDVSDMVVALRTAEAAVR